MPVRCRRIFQCGSIGSLCRPTILFADVPERLASSGEHMLACRRRQNHNSRSGVSVTDEQRNARFALAVLFGINLMNFFDRQIAGALLEPIRIEFGMTDTASAGVNFAFTLIYAIVGVPLG